MARLNRQPCATCQCDTLHTGITCNTCGTIVVMRDRDALRNAAIKTAMRDRWSPARRAARRAAKVERRAGKLRPHFDTPTARGPFGGGRARTRV